MVIASISKFRFGLKGSLWMCLVKIKTIKVYLGKEMIDLLFDIVAVSMLSVCLA